MRRIVERLGSAATRRQIQVVGLVIAAGIVSDLSVRLSPLGGVVAAWWPAAGLSALAVLASRGTGLAAAGSIAAVTAAGNLVAGRELTVAVLFGLANAVEAWIVARMLTRGRERARLESSVDVSRLIIAAVAGSVAIGLLAGTVAAVLLASDFPSTFLSLVASHFSALLIIVPLGLVRRRRVRGGAAWEAALQIAFLLTIVLVAFWPGRNLPLGFLPIIAILWAAFRLSTMLLAIELVVTSMLVTILTALGGGPFAGFADDGTRTAVVLLQVFLIGLAGAVFYVAATRNEWAAAVTQLGAREALLRSGIVSAESGIFIAEMLDQGQLRVVGANATALTALAWEGEPEDWQGRLLSRDPSGALFSSRAIDELVRSRTGGRLDLVVDDHRFDVDVAQFVESGARPVLTIVFTDVTARQARQQLALDAAEELRELNRQKDDFIASVSHELRTPVTSILGFSEQLAEAQLDEESRQAGVVIYRNARRLADTIEDVLELSRLSGTEPSTRPRQEVDVVTLVQEAIEDATGRVAASKRVRFAIEAPDTALLVRTLEQDLARVCANLRSNAVKFSPDGAEVRVKVSATPEGVEVRFADNGPGIPTAEMASVWARFYRVQAASHRGVPGTGLGLPIVRALVENHLGGTVSLVSDGVRGTEAVLRIPRDVVSPSFGAAADRIAAQEGAE